MSYMEYVLRRVHMHLSHLTSTTSLPLVIEINKLNKN